MYVYVLCVLCDVKPKLICGGYLPQKRVEFEQEFDDRFSALDCSRNGKVANKYRTRCIHKHLVEGGSLPYTFSYI